MIDLNVSLIKNIRKSKIVRLETQGPWNKEIPLKKLAKQCHLEVTSSESFQATFLL